MLQSDITPQTLTVVYHGPRDSEFAIHAPVLVASLNGLTKMYERSNRLLVSESIEIEVIFRDPREGSFEFDVLLQYAEDVRTIGIVATILEKPILMVKESVVKFLCDRLSEHREKSGGSRSEAVEPTTGDNNIAHGGDVTHIYGDYYDHATVNNYVSVADVDDIDRGTKLLASDRNFVRNSQSFVKPLRGSTTDIELRENGRTRFAVNRDSVECFDQTPTTPEDEISIFVNANASVTQVNFDSGNNWRIKSFQDVQYSQSGLPTSIVDAKYVARMDRGLSISNRDVLHCDFERVTSFGTAEPKNTYRLLKVHRHINSDGTIVYKDDGDEQLEMNV